MPINIHFDFLAPIYDRVIGKREPEEFVELLNLPTNGILLDAGGGTGRASLGLRSHVGQLIIADLSRPMLTEARSKGHDHLVQASSKALALPDNSVDRIMVVDALHHFANQAEVVCELLRVLKPGGLMLIEEPDMNKFQVKLVALGEKLALMGSHIHYPEEIGAMVELCGIKPEIRKDGAFAAFILAEKPLH